MHRSPSGRHPLRFAPALSPLLLLVGCGNDSGAGDETGEDAAGGDAQAGTDADAGADVEAVGSDATDTDATADAVADAAPDAADLPPEIDWPSGPWDGHTVPCPSGGLCVPLRLFNWNVGNPDTEEPRYPLRLSYQAYEDHLAEKIQGFEPDIVFFQEIMSPSHCAALDPQETDPARTCFDWEGRPAQAQRLVGDGYSVVCDVRNHVECIAVRDETMRMFDALSGDPLAPGSFQENGAETPELPMEACTYSEGTCNNTNCDWESTVSGMYVERAGISFRAVHVHPNAAGNGNSGFYSGAPCRVLQLQQATDLLVDPSLPNLFAGDFNLVWPTPMDPSERTWWEAHEGEGQMFTHINPRDAANRLVTSNRNLVTIDHVWVAGMEGTCTIYGQGFPVESPEPGLDADFDWTQVPDGRNFKGRTDHFAFVCDIFLPVPR